MKINDILLNDLKLYIDEYRKKLLSDFKISSSKLFFAQGGLSLLGVLSRLSKRLKNQYSFYKSFTHLRESRISIWVAKYSLIDAQYFSGIKYLSSMERYDRSDYKELQYKLEKSHPINNMT